MDEHAKRAARYSIGNFGSAQGRADDKIVIGHR